MRYTYENTAAIGKKVNVFLDGKEVDDVLEANTDEGYIIQLLRNSKGHLYADENGDAANCRKNGKVVVSSVK